MLKKADLKCITMRAFICYILALQQSQKWGNCHLNVYKWTVLLRNVT